MAAVLLDELNAYIAQGHVLLLHQRLDHIQLSEEQKKNDLVKYVSLEDAEFSALKLTLKVDANAVAVLLSPTGKVLSCSTDIREVERDAKRFEGCLAMALKESVVQEVPVRRTADEWIKASAENNGSAFSVLKEATPAVAPSFPAEESAETTRLRGSVRAARGKTPDPITATSTLTERRSTNTDGPKPTKVAIRFTNGSPKQVLDIQDACTTQLKHLVSELNKNVISFSTDYPRKEYDIASFGSKTLIELGLDANPSLLAKVEASTLAKPEGGVGERVQYYVALLWSVVIAVLSAIVNSVKSIVQPRVVAPPVRSTPPATRQADNTQRDEKSRKRNQYWNGDSTVFESPDEGNDSTPK